MPGTDPEFGAAAAEADRKALRTDIAEDQGEQKLEALSEGLRATFDGPDVPEPQVFDLVLIAVGRTANGNEINAAAAGSRCR